MTHGHLLCTPPHQPRLLLNYFTDLWPCLSARRALQGIFYLIRRHSQIYYALTNFPHSSSTNSSKNNPVAYPGSPQDAFRKTLGRTRKVDLRLPGKGISNSHGARPVHLIISMITSIRTSSLSVKPSRAQARRERIRA